MEKLLTDLGFAADSISALILAWIMGAQEMGYFTKQEFTTGLEKLNSYTLANISKSLVTLEQSINSDPSKFLELYKFAFTFGATSPQSKSVDVETAAAMLELILPKGSHTKQFAAFLRGNSTTYKVINRDQWMCFLEFSRTVRPDLLNYDDAEAYPLMFDEYVSSIKKSKTSSS